MLGNSHGRKSLVGCSPWGCKELDTTERLHFHISLSCFGEGNGNPLQYSCLENPWDGGAWWAAVYGVAQSRTRLKRLSSSSKLKLGFPVGSDGKESACNAGDLGLISALGRSPGGGQPTPIFSPGESPWTEEPSRLPWGCKELDTTEQRTKHKFMLIVI